MNLEEFGFEFQSINYPDTINPFIFLKEYSIEFSIVIKSIIFDETISMNKLTKKIAIITGLITIILGIVFSFIWEEIDKIMSLFFMGSLLIVLGVLPGKK